MLFRSGRATQLLPGDSQGGLQAEGCHVSQNLHGEGGVTPANTPNLDGQAQLYRHVVELHHHPPLQPQVDVQGGGEASLVHINTAIAS